MVDNNICILFISGYEKTKSWILLFKLNYIILLDSLHYAKFPLEFLAEDFRCHVHHFQYLADRKTLKMVHMEPKSIC